MTELTPGDLRHIKVIVTAEREVYTAARAALASWLPLVADAVLDDVAITAAIDPDRAGRAQATWEKALEPVLATLSTLWAKRYRRKGKNKRKMDSELAKFRARTAELLSGVTKKVYADVQNLVVEMRATGASDEAVREAVRERLVVENYDSTAVRISRTSVMSAYNDGAEQGFREFALATGQPVTKTWRAILDDRVRESHASSNGQTVPVDGHFTVGGYLCQHPGDTSLPPWESVSCRCVATFSVNGIVAGIGQAGVTFTVERSAGRTDYTEWVVVRDDTQEIVGQHASKAMAFVQLRALQQAAVETVEEDSLPSDDPAGSESTEIDEASPVVAALGDLPTGWRGPIAALDRLTGDGRWLATPPGGLRTREYPMSVTRKHVSESDDIFIGNIDAAWIQDGMLWGEGSFDLGGTDGAEAARLVGERLLFTMSIDPDQVTAEQRLVDADGNVAADDVMLDAINTGDVPEGYDVVLVFTDWRLSSVALVSIPAYDEARIEPVFDYVRPDYAAQDKSDSAMIALRPMTPEYFVVEGGLSVEDLHVTLRYLGDAETIGSGMIPGLHGAALSAAGALKRKKKRARVAGYGQLGDEGAVVLFLNGPEIADAHLAVESALQHEDYVGLPEPHAPYLAHMTLGYGIDPELAKKYVGYEFDFAGVSFDHGRVRSDYPAPAEPVVAAVSGSTGLPVADSGRAWDGGAAAGRMLDAATDDEGNISVGEAGRGFLWRDGDGSKRGDYRLPFADIVNDRLTIVPRGVSAAAARHNQAKGVDHAAIAKRICSLYAKIRKSDPSWPECPTAASSDSLVASVGGQVFSAKAFERKAEGPTALTVDEDGSVYGHVRLYGTCYQYGGGQGDGGYCVEPPLSACDYEKFHVHGAKLDNGKVIAVGALTYGDGHESRGGLWASQDHYNNVATVAAKVVASEDQWGVWIAGEVCSDHADRAYDLLLSPMSGHWEPDADNGGHLEMLAAHIVVTPGYAVRGRGVLASFDDDRNATRLIIPSPWQKRTGGMEEGSSVTPAVTLGLRDLRRADALAWRAGVDRESRIARALGKLNP